jgi:hypothetical protein
MSQPQIGLPCECAGIWLPPRRPVEVPILNRVDLHHCMTILLLPLLPQCAYRATERQPAQRSVVAWVSTARMVLAYGPSVRRVQRALAQT